MGAELQVPGGKRGRRDIQGGHPGELVVSVAVERNTSTGAREKDRFMFPYTTAPGKGTNREKNGFF